MKKLLIIILLFSCKLAFSTNVLDCKIEDDFNCQRTETYSEKTPYGTISKTVTYVGTSVTSMYSACQKASDAAYNLAREAVKKAIKTLSPPSP